MLESNEVPIMNVVVLRGVVSRPIEVRELSTGPVVTFDLATDVEGGRLVVPVAWHDAPRSATELEVGAELVVTGVVRRRFFRSAGATASRTEVVADAVVAARRTRQAATALTKAVEKVGATR
jgi:single-strand DNA-binding protein